MLKDLIMNVPAMLMLTVGAYLLGLWIKNKSGISLIHPFLISIPVIITILVCLDIPCDFYIKSNQPITFLLGPSVVALGLLLYDNIETIKKSLLPILVSVSVGSVVGIVSVLALCNLFNLDEVFYKSLAAKSVTTPIAIDLTATIGGNVSLAAVSVVLCGFSGAILGPVLVKVFRIKNPISKGLALGCASHGLGTASAIEMGAIEGAAGGLAIALMGIATSLFLPLFS